MASSSRQTENGQTHGRYSRIDEYGFVRDEDFNYKLYENFFSEYTAVLAHRAKRWNRLMNNGKRTKVKPDRTVKRFCRKGIPMQYLKMVWMNVSGAQKRLGKNPDKFRELLSKDFETSPRDQALIESINTDLDRTFPDNIHFRDGKKSGDKLGALKRVLLAIGRYNTKVGYCQGMNYVAALLLLVVEDEESVFWLFISLIEDSLPEYYSSSMIGLRTDMEVLNVLVRERHPAISATLERESVNWVLLASKWFICLFVDVLPTETVLRIWDCLFLEGTKILFRVALLLIKIRASKAQEAKDMPEVIEAFKDLMKEPAALDCHNFMQDCFKEEIPLRMANIKRLREIEEAKIIREEEERLLKKREKSASRV